MKKRLMLLALSCMSTLSQAAVYGPYLGINAGMGEANFHNSSLAHQAKATGNYTVNEGGFAGRIFAGFMFNPYVGTEVGFAMYPQNTYSITSIQSKKFKTSAYDLLIRGDLPLKRFTTNLQNWEIIAKAGITRVHSSLDVDQDATVPPTSFTHSNNKTTFEFQGGIAYLFNPHAMIDLSWTHIMGSGDDTAPVTRNTLDGFSPSINALWVGFTYNWAA